jgi:hypothetical protein
LSTETFDGIDFLLTGDEMAGYSCTLCPAAGMMRTLARLHVATKHPNGGAHVWIVIPEHALHAETGREHPLSDGTRRRIANGLRKFTGEPGRVYDAGLHSDDPKAIPLNTPLGAVEAQAHERGRRFDRELAARAAAPALTTAGLERAMAFPVPPAPPGKEERREDVLLSYDNKRAQYEWGCRLCPALGFASDDTARRHIWQDHMEAPHVLRRIEANLRESGWPAAAGTDSEQMSAGVSVERRALAGMLRDAGHPCNAGESLTGPLRRMIEGHKSALGLRTPRRIDAALTSAGFPAQPGLPVGHADRVERLAHQYSDMLKVYAAAEEVLKAAGVWKGDVRESIVPMIRRLRLARDKAQERERAVNAGAGILEDRLKAAVKRLGDDERAVQHVMGARGTIKAGKCEDCLRHATEVTVYAATRLCGTCEDDVMEAFYASAG